MTKANLLASSLFQRNIDKAQGEQGACHLVLREEDLHKGAPVGSRGIVLKSAEPLNC